MTNDTNLQTILEEYAIASGIRNDRKILHEMTEKYPQFAADLEDFAAARAVISFTPETELSAEDEARYLEIGRANLQAILNENYGSALESLTDTAKAKGMNRTKFAIALGLSVSLVQYLEKRRLEFASIPKALIAKVAEILETGEHLVSNYLNQTPISAVNASFKTETRPEELAPKSFADAVREDQQLSDDEKRNLLEMYR